MSRWDALKPAAATTTTTTTATTTAAAAVSAKSNSSGNNRNSSCNAERGGRRRDDDEPGGNREETKKAAVPRGAGVAATARSDSTNDDDAADDTDAGAVIDSKNWRSSAARRRRRGGRNGDNRRAGTTTAAADSSSTTTTESGGSSNERRFLQQQQQQQQQQHDLELYRRLRRQWIDDGAGAAATNDDDDDDGSAEKRRRHRAVLRFLAECVSTSSNELLPAAERVVRETVYEIFLPYLAASSTTATTRSTSSSLRCREHCEEEETDLLLLGTVDEMLADARYAAAMLAPHVETVSDDGRERQRSNPIRRRLFEALQAMLLSGWNGGGDDDSTGGGFFPSPRRTIACCRTLVGALRTAYRMDGTERHANETGTDVDVVAVQSHVQRALLLSSASFSSLDRDAQPNDENTDDNSDAAMKARMTTSALELLLSLLRRHPEASAAFFLLLLENRTSRNSAGRVASDAASSSCSCCGHCRETSSHFLKLMHPSPENGTARISLATKQQQQALALDCALEVIANAPLNVWLQQKQQTSQQAQRQGTSKPVVPRGSLSYPDRIVGCLVGVVRATACLVKTASDDASKGLSNLSQSLLLDVPYQCVPALLDSAFFLVDALAQRILLGFQQNKETGMVFADTLVASSGGQMTPQGRLSPMSFALRAWLGSDEGKSFIRNLLSSTLMVHNRSVQARARLCRSLVRSYPDLIAEDSQVQQAFEHCFTQLIQSTEKYAGLDILVGFLEGRKDFLADDDLVPSHFRLLDVYPVLLKSTTDDESAPCKKLALKGYSFLFPRDWDLLAEANDEGCGYLHIASIMELCRNASDSVRTDSFKALGDVCSNYFSTQRSHTDWKEMTLICDEVSSLVLEGCHDQVAKVRSMALFAIGNLAMALRISSLGDLFHESNRGNITRTVRKCMEDPDEKVAGNAIRSIGHVVALLMATMKWDYTTTEEVNSFDIKDLLRFLSEKVRYAILSKPNLTSPSVLTWKQRQSAKKQSWGACNTLGLLFEAGLATEPRLREEVSECLEYLFECVENLEALHEKIVYSACATLRVLEASTMTSILERRGPLLLGNGIVTCSNFLAKSQGTASKKLEQDISLLLFHLLAGLSVHCAAVVIRSERVGPSVLNWLCDSMVEQDCPASSFGAFALAMQRLGVLVDDDIELRFSIRSHSGDSFRDDACDDEL